MVGNDGRYSGNHWLVMGNPWVTVDHDMNCWVIAIDHWCILILVSDCSSIVEFGFEMTHHWLMIVNLQQNFWWVTGWGFDFPASWVADGGGLLRVGRLVILQMFWVVLVAERVSFAKCHHVLAYHVVVYAIYCHHQQVSLFVCCKVVSCLIIIHKPGPDYYQLPPAE